MKDSKKLWKSIDAEIPAEHVELGRYASDDYVQNPKQVVFVAARYKFVSKMLEGAGTVMEIGCGDGFGSPIVAQAVNGLTCLDINEELIEDIRQRNAFVKNATYEYFDFREAPRKPQADAGYLIDVIEHIFPEEEADFLANITASLTDHGILIIGTPNKTAEKYTSEWSRRGHVNLKTHDELRETGRRYFHNVFMFGMNDEVVHTGFPDMCHFLWAVCTGPKR